jgi:shikimate kinase
LLQVPEPQRRLQDMSAEREPLYLETAHIVVDVEGLSFDRLVDTVLARLAGEAT